VAERKRQRAGRSSIRRKRGMKTTATIHKNGDEEENKLKRIDQK